MDPFAFLAGAGSDPANLTLIFGPLAVLFLGAGTFALYAFFRRRRDEKQLLAEESLPPAEGDEPTKATGPAPELPWLERLKSGLQRTREQLYGALDSVFKNKPLLSQDVLEQIHEALYRSDIGARTVDKLVAGLRRSLPTDQATDLQLVIMSLKQIALSLLSMPSVAPTTPEKPPQVILIVGVNGVGKTTTIAKLAAQFKAEGKTVLLGAADTFRAAATEQLRSWGDKLDIPVIHHQMGADPAAVCFDTVKAAKARGADIAIIDTAGRLHAKTDLMNELSKINRSIGKELPGAPHETWLVIDATTGQNAVQQVKAFKEVVALTGIVVTKLDGTAKGGVVLGIVDQFQLPVRYIGVGEKATDLQAFSAEQFVESIFT